jgi:hypothetical protein
MFYFCHRIFFLSVSPGGTGLVCSSVLVRFALVRFLLSTHGFQDSIYLSIFPKAEDFSVFPKAEDLSDFQVWDIGQVLVSNFDWCPFSPLWSPSPVLHPVYLIPSLPPAHLR